MRSKSKDTRNQIIQAYFKTGCGWRRTDMIFGSEIVCWQTGRCFGAASFSVRPIALPCATVNVAHAKHEHAHPTLPSPRGLLCQCMVDAASSKMRKNYLPQRSSCCINFGHLQRTKNIARHPPPLRGHRRSLLGWNGIFL